MFCCCHRFICRATLYVWYTEVVTLYTEKMINIISVLNATERGDAKALHRILQSHARINVDYSDTHSTPLHVASERGDLQVVQVLLAYYADVNRRRKGSMLSSLFYCGDTPISLAAKGRHEKVVQELLKHKAEPLMPVGYLWNRKRLHFKERVQNTHRWNLGPEHTAFLAKEYKVLPLALVKKTVEQESCSICCEEFELSDSAGGERIQGVHLFCGHALHLKCLLEWDKKGGRQDLISCPLCRSVTKREIFV